MDINQSNISTTPHLDNLIAALNSETSGKVTSDRKRDKQISRIAKTAIRTLSVHAAKDGTQKELEDKLIRISPTEQSKQEIKSFVDRLLGLNAEYTRLSPKQLITLDAIFSKNETPNIGLLLQRPGFTETDLYAIAPYLPTVVLTEEPCKSWEPEKMDAFLKKCTLAHEAVMPDGTEIDLPRKI